jgi:hypothetical protein
VAEARPPAIAPCLGSQRAPTQAAKRSARRCTEGDETNYTREVPPPLRTEVAVSARPWSEDFEYIVA